MIYRGAEAGQAPERVKLERTPSRIIVRLADNVRPYETESEEIRQTMYRYDEVVFDLPEERSGETVTSITEDFTAWWEFGSEDGDAVTLESRIEALEEMLLALI